MRTVPNDNGPLERMSALHDELREEAGKTPDRYESPEEEIHRLSLEERFMDREGARTAARDTVHVTLGRLSADMFNLANLTELLLATRNHRDAPAGAAVALRALAGRLMQAAGLLDLADAHLRVANDRVIPGDVVTIHRGTRHYDVVRVNVDEGLAQVCSTDPDLIWSGWVNMDILHRVS